MEREIKFRVWYREEWNNNHEQTMEFMDLNEFAQDEEFEDFIYMQYAELEDKNGTEVYDGDIIQWKDKDGETYRDLVYYNKGCLYPFYQANPEIDSGHFIDDFKEFEVIGNKYENKELLNG